MLRPELAGIPAASRSVQKPPVRLVDTIGELSSVWGPGRRGVHGGSLGPGRGGRRNMMEPAAYGASVLFGRYTDNFREIVRAIARTGRSRARLASNAAEQLTTGARSRTSTIPRRPPEPWGCRPRIRAGGPKRAPPGIGHSPRSTASQKSWPPLKSQLDSAPPASKKPPGTGKAVVWGCRRVCYSRYPSPRTIRNQDRKGRTSWTDRERQETPQTQPLRQQQTEVVVDDSGTLLRPTRILRALPPPRKKLILDFGLNPQPFATGRQDVKANQRLVMNFYTAKRLLTALGMTIQRHEQTFGIHRARRALHACR